MANTSINHLFGKNTNEGINRARASVARLLNAQPQEIIFTSGATEAIDLGYK